MPYYLVTQTSLIEAEDEVKAAQKVLAKFQLNGAVEFTVKFGEENIRQVTVTNVAASEIARPITGSPRPSLETAPESIVDRGPLEN